MGWRSRSAAARSAASAFGFEFLALMRVRVVALPTPELRWIFALELRVFFSRETKTSIDFRFEVVLDVGDDRLVLLAAALNVFRRRRCPSVVFGKDVGVFGYAKQCLDVVDLLAKSVVAPVIGIAKRHTLGVLIKAFLRFLNGVDLRAVDCGERFR